MPRVRITGTGFGSANAVYFGSNASSDFSVVSPDLITATAPTNAGSVNVTVVTPDGTSADDQAGRITYAPTGQLPITVSGQNLEIGGVPTEVHRGERVRARDVVGDERRLWRHGD